MRPDRDTITREYGLSHADVERVLPRLLGGAEVIVAMRQIEARYPDDRCLTAVLGPERERRLGGLRLVSTAITFHFERFDPAAVRDFIARFERATHKGGG